MPRPTYDTQSVCNIRNSFPHLTNPVGQIIELGERREIISRFCSGFNILGGGYFLTAGHCITSTSSAAMCIAFDADSAVGQGKCVVNFGYDACQYGITDTRTSALKFVTDGRYSSILRVVDHGYCGSNQLDYAILQLEPNSASFGTLELSSESPDIDNQILVVHHPEGYAKQYSTGDITHYDQEPQTFGHSAHTEGGSSGAPIISQTTSEVIGVHVRGNPEQTAHTAVTSRSIVEDAHQRGRYWVNSYLSKFGLFQPQPSTSIAASNAVVLYQPPSGPKCC